MGMNGSEEMMESPATDAEILGAVEAEEGAPAASAAAVSWRIAGGV